ncbi:hypothetical protein SEA_VINCENZO_22 [Mycobacterium phage Vincenzo]|uniref:Uncharacterized protein n=2 Tax=Coopervirus vincenzo TaxID=1983110 RepID=A0A0F6WDV6_9CAUD|nr:hypothetical protein SEA_VINCENZO_22 [Mycobacterium phage Vincenzo]AKF14284.1 hypothetical protein SEA_VINCENZO_22 [Mycobacterium phage Vincenzo]AKF14687.1 hypothetical protein SEA_ALANGRANT_22 [Mycobacterium phage AlanGrant]
MTSPCRTDPAMEVIGGVTTALAEFFRADQVCPPMVGATANIRFFAGDGAPLAAWDSHASQGCNEPFVWVRAMRRYQSQTFPNPTVATNCKLLRVLPVEVGVAWCAVVDQEPKWSDYAHEAAVSMDTAWRLETALCAAATTLRNDDSERLVGTDIVNPYGPEGGVIAWIATLYASY